MYRCVFLFEVISSLDAPDEEKGNDWLYIVMADIVNTHNNFIQGLYTMTNSQCLSVYHLLPSDPSKIPLTEFTLSHCIVGKKSRCVDDSTWGIGIMAYCVGLQQCRLHVHSSHSLFSLHHTPSLHGIDNFLQLVRSRYSPQTAAEGALPKALKNPMVSVSGNVVQQQTACQFHLHLLQEDVVTTYLAGKPPVESAAAIRTRFKFRNLAQQSSPHPKE